MLKYIQKWLHNTFSKKYGFGWLYRDLFYISEYFWQMMVFLADDIFVPEVRGFPGWPLTNIRIILKLKLSWVFPKFVSRNGILEKSQLRYFFESEQKLKYRLKFFSRNPGLVSLPVFGRSSCPLLCCIFLCNWYCTFIVVSPTH